MFLFKKKKKKTTAATVQTGGPEICGGGASAARLPPAADDSDHAAEPRICAARLHRRAECGRRDVQCRPSDHAPKSKDQPGNAGPDQVRVRGYFYPLSGHGPTAHEIR